MFKPVNIAIEDQKWAETPIEAYFHWNTDKPSNSGQIHIRSKKEIGFFDGEIVNIYVEDKRVLIVSTGTMRKPGERAKDTNNWRTLTQGNLKVQDFDFKHKPLFKLLKFQFSVTFEAKKVRACDYVNGVSPDKFAILIDTK